MNISKPCSTSATPSNSHSNGTVKGNTNINSKQMTLKATNNYVYTYLLKFVSLFYILYSISTVTDNKSPFFVYSALGFP